MVDAVSNGGERFPDNLSGNLTLDLDPPLVDIPTAFLAQPFKIEVGVAAATRGGNPRATENSCCLVSRN